MARDRQDIEDIAEILGIRLWDSFIERSLCEVREIYMNGGWRGSKTWSAIFHPFYKALYEWSTLPAKRLLWLPGPDYEQAREEYFTITDWFSRDPAMFRPLGEISHAINGPLTAVYTMPSGGELTIATKSAENPTSLGSVAPDFIIACEAGQMSTEARDRLRGRTSTKNCPIIWSGTFENDKGKAQFAWFEQESRHYQDNPTPRRRVFSLPIWENIALFGNCLDGDNGIDADPTLAAFCPDDNHGPAHSGIDPNHPDRIPGTDGVPLHPKVRELYEENRHQPDYWNKFYAGKPTGQRNSVYKWAQTDSLTNFATNIRLISLKDYERKLGRQLLWLRKAGGQDFGTVHPSAVAVCAENDLGDTWFLHADQDDSAAIDWVWTEQKRLSREFNIPSHMWNRDPMVKYVPSYVPGDAVSGSMFAREARVGIMNAWAKPLPLLNKPNGRLFFNADNPGCVLLFDQIQRVHRKIQANGQWAYDRTEGEDMAAAGEDAMAKLHGEPHADVPDKVHMRNFNPPRSYTRKQRVRI